MPPSDLPCSCSPEQLDAGGFEVGCPRHEAAFAQGPHFLLAPRTPS